MTACTELWLLPSLSALPGDILGATQIWEVLAAVVGVSQVSAIPGDLGSAHAETAILPYAKPGSPRSRLQSRGLKRH